MTQQAATQEVRGNADDHDYDALLGRLNQAFRRGSGPLFTTDAAGLWETYLESFPESSRQFHNCSACRHFINRFGGLVRIDEHGATSPAMWHQDVSDEEHRPAFEALARVVSRAKVTGVFLSSKLVWGEPVTGIWTHLAVFPTPEMVFKGITMTPGQAMAEKSQDFKNVVRALEEFTPAMVAQALTLLNSEALYRSEKVIGPAKWLSELHAARAKGGNKANKLWRAVATAPAGFCHPRSSMVGTLLEDLAAGLPFESVSRRFSEKMNPLQYQRPQSAPSAGNIAQAEKIVEQLQAAGALARRFARLDEVETVWKPFENKDAPKGGVFGHLRPKEETPSSMNVPEQKITWEKFQRVVLPTAKALELRVPSHGTFIALVTAENQDAPPIIQWDSVERRNPFTWYVYHSGSPASQWGLTPDWTRVTGISLLPSMWHGFKGEHHGAGAILILDGARDSANNSAAIFPEFLKSEFHGVRKTIEAFSRGAKISGYEQASACGFDMPRKGSVGREARVRVTDQAGNRLEYRIDRWD